MIKKISRIKNMGIFSDFSWPTDLQGFNRYNLFYGMNGSGKTTLSSLFSLFSSGSSETYPELAYSIETARGNFDQSRAYPQKIRVFNSEYVQNNIGEIEGKLHPILIVGKENKDLVEKLRLDEKTLEERKGKELLLKKEKEKKEKELGKKFTDIAKVISSDTSGQATRNYRKPDAERDYRGLSSLRILNEDEAERCKQTLRQEVLDEIYLFASTPNLQNGQVKSVSETAAIIVGRVRSLLAKTVSSEIIKHLKDNVDIQSWVEAGVHLHKKHSSAICEYCLQTIPSNRLEDLANHFNEADQNFRDEIDVEIRNIVALSDRIRSFQFPSKAAFYSEFRGEHQIIEKEFISAQQSALKELASLKEALEDKLGRRTEALSSNPKFDTSILESNQQRLADLASKHNEKSKNFSERVNSARKALEVHHLSLIDEDIKAINKNIKEIDDYLLRIQDGSPELTDPRGMSEISDGINEMRGRISNSHKAAQELTENLHIFLGRRELEFIPENEGYTIKRHGKPAKRLSEGEKTAIAFVYFIIHLKDQDFSTEDGIIVIDDPISSLDTNSIYQAFAFLKTAVSDAKQAFIFTHNYEFLKLLLNWMKNIPKKVGKKSYYMLNTTNISHDKTARIVGICPLDRELLDNESEYNFLFKTLCQYKSDGSISSSYHIPNVARKVLETFVDFYCPSKGSLYEKVKAIDYNPVKKSALLKFVNDLSHPTTKWFDPALVPETQNNVHHLLEMIEALLPNHHKAISENIQRNDEEQIEEEEAA